MGVCTAAELVGKNVANVQGHIIGSIQDVLVDTQAWQVCDVRVRVDKQTAKELGLKAPLFGRLQILIDIRRVVSVADQVVVDIATDGFADYLQSREES